MNALVSIICICHNHARFVTQALDSVIAQTYQPIELIVIDDASTDGGGKIIKQWLAHHPNATLLLNAENIGYCKTFNRAFRIARGHYIIDLAADDILLPNRVEVGVAALEKAGKEYGVTFSDAEHIDENGTILWRHSDKYPHHTIPSGDIYIYLINRYFICSPTMMFRREVVEGMNGYDESLTYEDFDFWIRSSRVHKYMYTPQVLVRKRRVSNSLSQRQKRIRSDQSYSTFLVCQKIRVINLTEAERIALNARLVYEMKTSLRQLNFKVLINYFQLWLMNRSN